MKNILTISVRLMAVCMVSSAGLAVVYRGTSERIKHNQEMDLHKKIVRVLPDAVRFETQGNKTIGYVGDMVIGTAVECSRQGYGGPVRILAGISPEGKILAIEILSHKETPGLGKKIETQTFKDQFIGKTSHELYIKKDSSEGIDAITAATISSRAVIDAVRKAMEQEHIP